MTAAGSVERILAEARTLALLDAAWLLWRRKDELDSQPTISWLKQVHPAASDDALQAAVQEAIAIEAEARRETEIAAIVGAAAKLPLPDAAYFLSTLKVEHDHRHVLSQYLRHAHPKASHEALAEAVSAALKLEADCRRYLVAQAVQAAGGFDAAVERLKSENRGFAEATYRLAWQHYLKMMRGGAIA